MSKESTPALSKLETGGKAARPKNWRFSAAEADTISQKLARIQSLHGALSQIDNGSVNVGSVSITIGPSSDPYNDRLTASMTVAVRAEIRDQLTRLSQEVAEDVENAGYPQPEVADQTRND